MRNLSEMAFPFELVPPFRHVRGYGFEAVLPEYTAELGNIYGHSMRSPFTLCENGIPLLARHGENIGIWYSGGGHYNHVWNLMYFSSSDNSDPNTNGRRYTLALAPQAEQTGFLPFPQRLHITCSHECNLTCRICRDKPYVGPGMSMRLFDKIAEECFPYISELRLDSGGELLLNRNLPAIIQKISGHGVSFFTSSNGMLLTPKKARLLAESTLHHIQISLDSPDKNTLEWIRRGANFERVIQGIRNLVQARHDVGRPFLITLHAAVMRENVRQLPDLVRLAHSLGAEGVTACHLFTRACMGIDSSCFWNQAEYDSMLDSAINTARSLNSFFYGPSPFSVPDSVPAPVLETMPNLCDYPEYGTYINPDGTVAPCCIASMSVLGNLHEQSFASIWNGEAYQQLRSTYRTNNPSVPLCKNCLVRKNNSLDYAAYFAPEHWPAVQQRIAAEKKWPFRAK